MKPEEDAFGQHLLACLKSENVYEIIERDDAYIDVGPGRSLYFSKSTDWDSHITEALNLAQGRILDVGLGAGRHALYLQEQGFEVVGIDNSPLAVQVASERGVSDARVMSVNAIDESIGLIDTIIMLGNNWGLLGGFEVGQKILKRFAEITSADARIIAETLNPYTTAEAAHLRYHQRNRELGRMGGQIRFRVRFKEYCGDWMDYLFNSVPEVEHIISGTGWYLTQTIGDTNKQYALILEKQ